MTLISGQSCKSCLQLLTYENKATHGLTDSMKKLMDVQDGFVFCPLADSNDKEGKSQVFQALAHRNSAKVSIRLKTIEQALKKVLC